MNSGIKNMNFFHVRNIEGQNPSEHTVTIQGAAKVLVRFFEALEGLILISEKKNFFIKIYSYVYCLYIRIKQNSS